VSDLFGNEPESKECSKCKKVKPLTDFTWNKENNGQYRRRRPECKKCEYSRRKEERNAYKKAGSPKRPELGTPCDICGRTDRPLRFDHCHETGKHRGWLCNNCNVGMGHLGDNLESLLEAVKYLERNGAKNDEQLFE
jgi:5-methylcytosine-specific restriction endonuclease McrA